MSYIDIPDNARLVNFEKGDNGLCKKIDIVTTDNTHIGYHEKGSHGGLDGNSSHKQIDYSDGTKIHTPTNYFGK